jgi:hypothetical protein
VSMVFTPVGEYAQACWIRGGRAISTRSAIATPDSCPVEPLRARRNTGVSCTRVRDQSIGLERALEPPRFKGHEGILKVDVGCVLHAHGEACHRANALISFATFAPLRFQWPGSGSAIRCTAQDYETMRDASAG